MDRRVTKTLDIIKEAYLKWTHLKPANKITVSDICNEANINRGTFYRYYLDIIDLKEKLEEDAAMRLVNTILYDYGFDGYSIDGVNRIFSYLKENPDDTYLLFEVNGNQDSSHGLQVVYSQLEERSLPHWTEKVGICGMQAKIVFYHSINSIFNLIKLWVRKECELEEEEFKELYLNLITKGTDYYIYPDKR